MEGNFKRAMREVFQGERNELMRSPAGVPEAAPQRRPAAQPATPRRESACITRGTRVRGDIVSDSDILLEGELEGTLTTEASVTVSGTVTGDIECLNCELNGARINGCIKSAGNILIRAGSVVVGDLTAQSARISGELQGNITVAGELTVESSARIIGDIVTGGISIEQGAVLQGSLQSQPRPAPEAVLRQPVAKPEQAAKPK